MTIKDAIKLYYEKYPDLKISKIFDIGNAWVVSAASKNTNEILLISPTSIDKITGEMKVFFPPDHRGEFDNAIPISIEEIEIP